MGFRERDREGGREIEKHTCYLLHGGAFIDVTYLQILRMLFSSVGELLDPELRRSRRREARQLQSDKVFLCHLGLS